jgi:hypothetical protein
MTTRISQSHTRKAKPMKTRYQAQLCLLGILAVLLLFAGATHAATINSSPFSIGYGAQVNATPTWNTVETSSANSPTTQGDFTFSPVLTGGIFSGNGPIVSVPGGVRTLATGGAGQNVGNSGTFGATINASWTGPTPGDAAATPNYQISLVIDSIRIYGTISTSFPTGNDLAFGETTVGHTGTSPAIILNTTTANYQIATNYNQLTWDPADYFDAGTTTSRSFNLVAAASRPVDDFEVFGHVVLSYDVIPEPGAVALVLAAGIALTFIRSRRFTKKVRASSKSVEA